MAAINFDLATPEDDAALRRLLREQPMPGRISLTFEREPCYFRGAVVEGDFHQTLVARAPEPGRLVGMGSRSVRRMFVNGLPQSVGYLNQVRVASEYGRGMHLARQLSHAFAYLQELHADGRAPFYFTSIVAQNTPARRLFSVQLPHFPSIHEYVRLHTYAVYLGRPTVEPSLPRGLRLARGSAADARAIADCLNRNGARHQLAPYWAEDALFNPATTPDLMPEDFFLALDEERVVGCLARWDQRNFKQTIVRGYAGALGRWRRWVNVAAKLGGLPQFPPPHTALRYCYASHIAVDDDNPRIFAALLSAFYNQLCRDRRPASTYDYFTLGFSETHPFRAVVRRLFRHVAYQSWIYLVAWDDSRLPNLRDGDRLPGLEIAVL